MNTVLFDLDGTLTDTGEGILKSVQYALDAYGIHGEPEEKLRRFVGPPWQVSVAATPSAPRSSSPPTACCAAPAA